MISLQENQRYGVEVPVTNNYPQVFGDWQPEIAMLTASLMIQIKMTTGIPMPE